MPQTPPKWYTGSLTGTQSMKHVLTAVALLLLVGCSDSPIEAAPPPAADATPAEPAAPAGETPAEILAGGSKITIGPAGATGCKDKTKAMALVEAGKKEDQAEFIKLWADGMQDYSCRGFTTGLGVAVEKTNEDGWDCILPIDDPDNKACFWIETGLLVQ